MMDRKDLGRPQVGLALSGGGARGFAHVGVIKVLANAGVPIDMLSGTSAGGAVAAVYATGMSLADFEREALCLSQWRTVVSLMDPNLPRLGLFSGERVEAYFARFLGERTFDDLVVPLTLVAVDLENGQEVDIREGRVLDALRATTAFPGVFEPKRWNGRLLVDGGLLNNLPVDVLREAGADVVIAVDVGAQMDEMDDLLEQAQRRRLRPRISAMMDTMMRSVNIIKIYIRQRKLAECPPDVLLRPRIPEGIGVFRGFTAAREAMACGEEVARQALPEILALCGLEEMCDVLG